MKSVIVAIILSLIGVSWLAADEATPVPDKGLEVKEEKPEKIEENLLDKLGIKFYGHFKLDMARDSAETNFGDTAFFVKQYNPGAKDEEINIHARHTRLGLNWFGPEMDGVKAFGKIEIDFLGKSDQKNTETEELQADPRMRHAFMRFDFNDGWSLLAGQTWDLFASLNMRKLNTMVGWGQGNLGFRRPQLRIAKKFMSAENKDVTLSLAIAQPVARDKEKDFYYSNSDDHVDNDIQDDGADRGTPDVQGHIGFTMPGPSDKPIKFGIGGFIGWREISGGGSASLAQTEHYTSYAGAIDLTVPLTNKLELIGEIWQGQALDGYRGGIWQSYVVHNNSVSTIDARGAFVNFIYKPIKKWMLVGGAGIDDPHDRDFRNSYGRYKNTTLFGNVRYNFYKGATVGIEYERMNTNWGGSSGTKFGRKGRVNHRIQTSFMLKF